MPGSPRTESDAPEQQDDSQQLVGGGTAKNNNLLYAAGDVIAWVAPQNSTPPVSFESIAGIAGSTYKNCGWVDTSGYIFKLDETVKDIPAAGTLTPIRTILTGGAKTAQCTFLEAQNPYVRSMYDDVPIFPVTSSPLKPSTGRIDPSCGTTAASVTVTDTAVLAGDVGSTVTGAGIPLGAVISAVTAGTSFTLSVAATATATGIPLTIGGFIASYVIPDPPLDNRYSVIFDTIDGSKQMRLFAPNVKVTARGNDQPQQADIEMLDLTFTMYPGLIGGVPGVAKRYINYAQDVSAYFT